MNFFDISDTNHTEEVLFNFNIKQGEQINFQGDDYLKSKDMGTCFICKKNKTRFLSLSFEGYICSQNCSEVGWKAVFNNPHSS